MRPMRIFIALLICLTSSPVAFANSAAASQIPDAVIQMEQTVVLAARARTALDVRYDPKYVSLSYPGGDVPADTGVCTDVVIRTFRAAYDYDFQKAIHEDMRANFKAYPKSWGLKRPDKNIDHRRVPNIERFLKRKGASLPITKNPEDYRPGDVVSWRLGGSLPHIGVVSDKKSKWGTPLIIHNVGQGVVEDDLLFNTPINGHFRYHPRSNTTHAYASNATG